jgi:signal transduction histidine kinase
MKQEVLGPIDTPRYREYVEHIHDSAQVLMDIIDDILDLSRIEAGRHDIDPAVHDAGDIARSCLEIVSMKAGEKGVRLDLDAEADTPVFADARALRQVLLNLITNAVKFTPDGGTVTIRVEPHGRRGTVFAVRDTGVGMSPEDVEVALQPFGRIAQAGRAPEQGTGLGLPIAQRLIELHGGRLTVDSAPGKGTTVRVTLPATPRTLSEPDDASVAA